VNLHARDGDSGRTRSEFESLTTRQWLNSALRVDDIAKVFRNGAWACFGHDKKSSHEHCAIKQHSGGQTQKMLEVGGRNVDLALTELYTRMGAIEKRVDDVEDDAIFHGKEINLKNVQTKKYIRVKGNDDVIVGDGGHTYTTESRFTVNRR